MKFMRHEIRPRVITIGLPVRQDAHLALLGGPFYVTSRLPQWPCDVVMPSSVKSLIFKMDWDIRATDAPEENQRIAEYIGCVESWKINVEGGDSRYLIAVEKEKIQKAHTGFVPVVWSERYISYYTAGSTCKSRTPRYRDQFADSTNSCDL
jgi:hypothetical protein